MSLQDKIQAEVLKLEGPIVIFGAGGFIGANLFRAILQHRTDVFAVTSKPFVPWRLDDINPQHIIHCNIIKKNQLEETIFNLSAEDFQKLVIAYEPIWAIGTGVTASTEQAQEMLAFIRSIIAEKFGKEIAENTSILYGGSCNAKNAPELFAQPDIDGGLIGGASLKAADFVAIIDAF